MADILLDRQTVPVSPAASQAVIWVENAGRALKTKDDAGFMRGHEYNFSTASQAPAAASRTYLTGSAITMPSGKIQIGTCFRWRMSVTKTAAGVAASTFDICFGTAGTTADTARVSFTKPAGTAVVDEGFIEIMATCRGPLSSACIVAGNFRMIHNLAATGHLVISAAVVTTISAGFDVTGATLIAGVCVTSGAADAITFQQVQAEAWNL
jgi:hypothetical protein